MIMFKNMCQPGLGVYGASLSLPGRYGGVDIIFCVLHHASLSRGVESVQAYIFVIQTMIGAWK